MEQVYRCDSCRTQVTEDEAFLRSVNLRSVAWCRPCWFDRHPELGVPAQRTPEASGPAARRWLVRR